MNENTNGAMAGQSVPSILSAPRLLSWAVSFYKSHLTLILSISAVPLVFGVAQVFIGRANASLVGLLTIVTFVAALFARLALLRMVSEGGHTFESSFKAGSKMFMPFVWIGALTGFASLGGVFLFVIPGIIVSILLSLSTYILFAEGKKGFDAIIQSWYYVRGNWGAVFWRFLFLGLILMIIGMLFALLTGGPMFNQFAESVKGGMMVKPEIPVLYQVLNLLFSYLVALPLSLIYSFGIYQSLRQLKTSEPTPEEKAKIKKHIVIFMIIAGVGICLLVAFSSYFIYQFGAALSGF